MTVSNSVALCALINGDCFYWWSGSSPCTFLLIEMGFKIPFVVYRQNNSIQKKRVRNLTSLVYLSPVSTHLHLI